MKFNMSEIAIMYWKLLRFPSMLKNTPRAKARGRVFDNLFFIGFVIALFFISSCTKNQQNTEGDLEFKQMCQNAGYEWMKMKPTQDGKFIKDAQECFGCMVEGIEHICDKEKFKEFVSPI